MMKILLTYILTFSMLLAGFGLSAQSADNEPCKNCAFKVKKGDERLKLSKKKVSLSIEISSNGNNDEFSQNGLDIKYCNINDNDIEDIVIFAAFDNKLQLAGADIPMTMNEEENSFSFNIDQIKGNDCGEFRIFVNPATVATSKKESVITFEIQFKNHRGKSIHKDSDVSVVINPKDEDYIPTGQTHIIEDIILEQDDKKDNTTQEVGREIGASLPKVSSVENNTAPAEEESGAVSTNDEELSDEPEFEDPAETGSDLLADKSDNEFTISKEEVIADLYIPNAFTPNNDGHNDNFRAMSTSPLNIKEFKVFNRWGELVHNDASRGWDGTVGGVFLSPGIYLYRMVIEQEGEAKVYTGNVSLIR